MSVKIVTDSTSYIPEKILKEYDISVISLSVAFGGNSYKETEIKNETFYGMIKDEIPKSSQPSVDDFFKIFEKIVKEGNDLVGVFISSEMSGTYSTANLVKNMIAENYPGSNIEIIDSRSNSMQLGLAAVSGARAAKENKSFDEVIRAINNSIKRTRYLFIPDTLKYLKKGGRIGTANALLGSLLQIKPILTVTNGKTDLIEKIRTRQKAVQKIIEIMLKDVSEFGMEEIIVHHINCYDDAVKLKNQLEGILNKNIMIADIGPVIGAHVGPGAIGIVYCTERDIK